jgi:hypothetical protein
VGFLFIGPSFPYMLSFMKTAFTALESSILYLLKAM